MAKLPVLSPSPLRAVHLTLITPQAFVGKKVFADPLLQIGGGKILSASIQTRSFLVVCLYPIHLPLPLFRTRGQPPVRCAICVMCVFPPSPSQPDDEENSKLPRHVRRKEAPHVRQIKAAIACCLGCNAFFSRGGKRKSGVLFFSSGGGEHRQGQFYRHRGGMRKVGANWGSGARGDKLSRTDVPSRRFLDRR